MNEPYPPRFTWLVQVLLDEGAWGTCLPTTDPVEAVERYEKSCAENPERQYRIIQETARYELVMGNE